MCLFGIGEGGGGGGGEGEEKKMGFFLEWFFSSFEKQNCLKQKERVWIFKFIV